MKKYAKQVAALAAATVGIRMLTQGMQGLYSHSRNFSKEIKNVTSLTDALSFSQIRKGIEELPPILGSATDLTQGLYQAISASVEPAEAIQFVGEAAKFAKAGLTDTLTAVDVLTTALNAYGLEAEKASWVSDLFFATIKEGKTTGEELSAHIGKAIPIFASAKIPLEELTAGLAAMTRQGIKTDQAMTHLKAMVTAFLKPSVAMTNALKKYGYATGAALLETEGLTGALELLRTASGGNADALAALLPNIRAMGGAMPLLKNEGATYVEILKEMSDVTGASNVAFNKQVDSIDRMEAQLQKAKEAGGKFVEGILMDVAPSLERLALHLRDVDFDAYVKGLSAAAAGFIALKGAAAIASVGIRSFAASLASTGIGVAVVGLGLALGHAIEKFRELKQVGKETLTEAEIEAELKKVNETQRKMIGNIQEYRRENAELIRQEQGGTHLYLREMLKTLDRNSERKKELLAMQKKINDEQKKEKATKEIIFNIEQEETEILETKIELEQEVEKLYTKHAGTRLLLLEKEQGLLYDNAAVHSEMLFLQKKYNAEAEKTKQVYNQAQAAIDSMLQSLSGDFAIAGAAGSLFVQLERGTLRSAQNIVNAVSDMTSGAYSSFRSMFVNVGELQQNIADRQLAINEKEIQEFELKKDAYIANVQAQGASAAEAEEKYNQELIKMNEEKAAKEQQAKRSAFEQNKLLRIADTLMAGAVASLNVWAMSGLNPAIAWGLQAMIGSLTAASAGLIASLNFPEMAKGGIVKGASAAGTPVIVGDKNTTEAIMPLDRFPEFFPVQNKPQRITHNHINIQGYVGDETALAIEINRLLTHAEERGQLLK